MLWWEVAEGMVCTTAPTLATTGSAMNPGAAVANAKRAAKVNCIENLYYIIIAESKNNYNLHI